MKINKAYGLNSKVVFSIAPHLTMQTFSESPSAISVQVKKNSLSDLIKPSSKSLSLQRSVFLLLKCLFFFVLCSEKYC